MQTTVPQNQPAFAAQPQQMQYNAGAGAMDQDETQSPIQQAVNNFIKQHGNASESGVELGNIIAGVSPQDPQSVKDAIEWLTNEGLVYTTLDDDHFKSTEE